MRQVPALPPLCSDLGQVPGARFVRKNCGYTKTTQRAAFCSTVLFISAGLRGQKAVKAAVHACLLREIPTAWTHLGLGGSWVGSAPTSCRQRGSLGFPARFWREDGEQDFSPCYTLCRSRARPGAPPSPAAAAPHGEPGLPHPSPGPRPGGGPHPCSPSAREPGRARPMATAASCGGAAVGNPGNPPGTEPVGSPGSKSKQKHDDEPGKGRW